MRKTLSCGAIGVKASNLMETLTAAKLGGFDSVEVDVSEIADLFDTIGANAINDLSASFGLKTVAFGLPGDYRKPGPEWKSILEGLPRLAKAAAAIGANRASTWILPANNDLNFDRNWDFHLAQLSPAAKIFADSGISFGLEFIGTKTLRDSMRYPFVYTIKGMLSLGKEMGPNVGLLLDTWHLFSGDGNIADVAELHPKKIVMVHVNDAPKEKSWDEQLDGERLVVGESGVIDIGGFMGNLRKIGYDGPVVCEPFSARLKQLPDDKSRLLDVSAAMTKILS